MLVVQAPSVPVCYTHTIYDLTILLHLVAHQHWYFVHPVCMINVLCVSPYFYCNLEMNIM